MSRHDDDLDFLKRDDKAMGGGLGAVVMMAGGAILFIVALFGMFYETEQALSSHNLRTFQVDFILVLLVGMPIFIGGVWLFNRGRRALR